jgi:ubiquinone/menaquinone biosynthesis C-methylase UbiE
MNTEKKDFDKTAANWDASVGRVQLAGDIAAAIKESLTLTRDMDVMDFGCGTGLVTLPLASLVRSVTAVDSSQGMLDVLRTKLDEQQISNVRTQYLDLDQGHVLRGQYHLVYSSMTFHHIKDLGPLLAQFSAVLTRPGLLCIADLDPDEGKFHSNNEGVFHFGFQRSVLREELMEAGFVDVQDRTAATMKKPQAQGGEREFTIFLITARMSG